MNNKEIKTVVVIPARYKSVRFEGKPIAKICGKPLIYWVYNQTIKVKNIDDVFIATDDERIKKAGVRMGHLDKVVAFVRPRPGQNTIGLKAYKRYARSNGSVSATD